ncbi:MULTISPECIES: hypothetical protein [unclassified Mesorhizobium]|uniref:hypothetical protein n=1 Tax=unclassified Mesorhizobium TaxID=325217 RepID=UPI000FCCB4F0|nr:MULTISPECIES: hypothetical protein [unclassified Mesorhizobium]RUV64056.1 hypothetical protein EOA85_02575 [Mesorhizobium sp. M5C.F.Ca.IN.020.29.1.1]RWA98027.1 MAG: hypothetical protein EOQ33_29160 [Mesorhizobium sp.]RWC25201.1 MAG: hypothetical protein EOS51_00860 [Mesorhizobium sp.]RWD77067.1 MAG: hypothetical protein EOS48_29835 [Mesorhizobium sp.]RWE52525.1 MAG: hypothetical protein EOS67_30035 [Mesorhizobium sp.]
MAVPIFFDRYRDVINRRGEAAARTPETLLDVDGRDELFYIPFEHVNSAARLVVVGITPGPDQIALAYRTVSSKIKVGLTNEKILAEAKKHGAFGGPTMRPKLLQMMRHFGFSELLGIEREEDLWAHRSDLLHATSIVPHAAFRRGKPFAGSFDDVLRTPVFRESFERDFVPSLSMLNPDALYVGLGPTPLAALDRCAEQGLIRPDQVLGAFAHSSTNGGSQVDVYLGLKSIDALNEKDPVRYRSDFLLPAYERMKAVTDRLHAAMKAAAE